MAVNEVPVAASFNTIVPAVAPAPVPKVKVWAPKFGLIFVPSMAAEAFTSAFTITPGAMAVALPEEVTSPVRLALVTTVVALPVLVTIPVRLAFVVTVAALPPILKLATGVVEFTTIGAVPVATVEVNEPVTLRLVPVAAPITGVTRVGEVANTATPEPVSSLTAPNKLAEVKVPNEVALPDEVTAPVKLALVEFAAATKAVVASCVVLVPGVAVGASGVPVSVGEALITTFPVPVNELETTFLLASVNKAWDAVALESTGAAVRVVTPVTVSVPPREVLPVKVLLPATVWAVVKSAKFCVAEPVPPLAMATIPVTLAAVPETLPVTLPETLPVNVPVNPVEVTDVNPASVVDEFPKLIAVDPIVRLLFVKELFGIPVKPAPEPANPVEVSIPVEGI